MKEPYDKSLVNVELRVIKEGDIFGHDESRMFEWIAPVDFIGVFSASHSQIEAGEELYVDYGTEYWYQGVIKGRT